MHKGRVEAFSDGVIAIILTVMVLELKVPEESNGFQAFARLWPVFSSYILSFIFIGIYWTNHHHLLQVATKVNGTILWANLHLLFWLSLIPFATAWMGDHTFDAWSVAQYGVVLLMSGVAYSLLTRSLQHFHGPNSVLCRAIGRDSKGWISMVMYAAAIPLSFVRPVFGCLIYIVVACMWLVPDRRIERAIDMHHD